MSAQLPDGFSPLSDAQPEKRLIPALGPKTLIRVHRDNQDVGIFAAEDALKQISSGELRADDWAVREGLPDWVFLSVILENYPASKPLLPPPLPPPLPHLLPVGDPDAPVRCPKCFSAQVTANKKGFGLGGAAVGGLLLGPLGLLGGVIGSSKVKITCLRCGHVFHPGEAK